MWLFPCGPIRITKEQRADPWWPLWWEEKRIDILFRGDERGLDRFLATLHGIDARFCTVMARRT